MEKEKIFFVMPAYNEEANIEAVVEQWHAVAARLDAEGTEARLVIANDGSKDGTYARMLELAERYPHFTPLDKPNSGHGATVLYLYRHALAEGADYVFQTDSDGQTSPEEFWEFWRERGKWDLQVGHRRGRQDGLSRVVVTKVLKGVVWLTFGVRVTDANTPFRLMRADALRRVMEEIPEDFLLANVALSAIAVKRGMRCRWVPITFKPRQGGENSINLRRIFRIGRQAVGDLYRLDRSLRRE